MEFKKVSGLEMPVLGLGTWKMGGKFERNSAHDKEDITAIKTALKSGITHIDTAEMYGNGHAEELVAEAVKGFDRSKLFITTKVSGTNLRYDDVISAANGSLKRLGTDYIDLYLIHWPNHDIPMKETMEAIDSLVERKLVRFIGVSNFNVEEIKEAQKYSKNKIIANQIEYSVLTRTRGMYTNDMESEIIPYCQDNGIFVIAYRPLAIGSVFNDRYKLLGELAEKYGKTRAQIGINWLISKKNVITIPKSSNIQHLKENIGAVGWKLEGKDVEKLDKILE